jgi:hypothetical protein
MKANHRQGAGWIHESSGSHIKLPWLSPRTYLRPLNRNLVERSGTPPKFAEWTGIMPVITPIFPASSTPSATTIVMKRINERRRCRFSEIRRVRVALTGCISWGKTMGLPWNWDGHEFSFDFAGA